ncbi:hypothetical protein BDN72DRAFT_965873 [Pluteus cervinus]|uniref:Uncharacterized protein n=1 Tax=Pluteus cervinus TaxID=181527 RepID=A0ACD3A2Z2_9AGAR|nr:hypothetical protein BDN72DRAFT_965873 [Pluteus cervinus]
MLVPSLLLLLQARAAPITAGPETAATIAHTLLWGIESRIDGSEIADRTVYSIVRSCLLTIAACVYRAIHQNIPDPEASWWRRQVTRMKITFYALIAPEAMVWWAMRQWFGAREVADQVNKVKPGKLIFLYTRSVIEDIELRWTRTHGHFAQMGGFGRLDNQHILYPPTLIKLLQDGRIDVNELKRISKKRIEDSSKGDILSKGILALQTTWFVFECLARLKQKLPLIELEVITLAFATLNTLTYAFWWNKPLDVLCPIYLHILPAPGTQSTHSAPPPPLESPALEEDGDQDDDEERHFLSDKKKEKKLGAVEGALRGLQSVWKVLCAGVANLRMDIKEDGWCTAAWIWFIQKPFLAVACPLISMFKDEAVHDEATHISTFYGMAVSKQKYFLLPHTHSTAPLENIIDNLGGPPFCLALGPTISSTTWDDDGDDDTWLKALIVVVGGLLILFFIFLGPIVYIFARLCLLVLAFLNLHDLSGAVFETVSWTTYIPHL